MNLYVYLIVSDRIFVDISFFFNSIIFYFFFQFTQTWNDSFIKLEFYFNWCPVFCLHGCRFSSQPKSDANSNGPMTNWTDLLSILIISGKIILAILKRRIARTAGCMDRGLRGRGHGHGHMCLLIIDAFFKIWIRRVCVCCIRSFIFELFLGSVYDMCTGTWSPMSQHLWRFGQSRGRWKCRGQFLSDGNGVYDTIIMIESGLKWMVERDESERI